MHKSSVFFKIFLLLTFLSELLLVISPVSLVFAVKPSTVPMPTDFPVETSSPVPLMTPTPIPTAPTFTPTPLPTPVSSSVPPPISGEGVHFLYDGNGVRVAKIVNGQVTLYAGGMEKNLVTGETVKYYNLGGRNIAYKSSLDNKVNYIVSDHLSSTRTVVSQEGIILSKANYYPYGEVRTQEGTLPSRQYTNQINDQETALYFYNARYYNPQNGTFITADKAQGPNRYAYVGGNPILRNDPSGNMETDPGGNEYDKTPSYTVSPEMFNLDPAAEWENSLLHAVGDWLGENTRFGTAYWEKRYPGFSQWSEEEQQGAVNKDLTGQFTDPSNLSGISGGVKIVGGGVIRPRIYPGNIINWRYESKSINLLYKQIMEQWNASVGNVSIFKLVAQHISNVLPYAHNPKLVAAADQSKNLTEIYAEVCTGVCRHHVSYTTGVLEKMGFWARAVIHNNPRPPGHALTTVFNGRLHIMVDASVKGGYIENASSYFANKPWAKPIIFDTVTNTWVKWIPF